MNRIPSNIFLHYLNRDTQEIFGILDAQNKENISRLRRGLNASILLCKEYCFMPLGFYFECQNTKELILQSLEFIKEGFLRLCIRESDIKDYVEKKQGQLRQFANDISYHGFFDEEYLKQLIKINPILLHRNVRVGDYCVNKWIEQHTLFIENRKGDLYETYLGIKNISDIHKITSGIQRAAIEVENGAFIWDVIVQKYKEMNISDKSLYQNLRIYFEKYYYEAYLIEYQASILYDFFLIDQGLDFALKGEYKAITNYSWFNTFLNCLGLEELLDLSAERVVELKYLPQFIELYNLYENICNKEAFDDSNYSLRCILSEMIINNEKNISDLSYKIKDITKSQLTKESRGLVLMENKKIDVLILVATEEEEKAILNIGGWESLTTKNGYTYFIKNEGMTFALARAVDMRETKMSIVGQYFIDELQPRFLSMAGFCAGQVGKTSLGDIIVPHKVYRYGMGKNVSSDQKYQEIETFNIDPVWRQKVERFGEEWRKSYKIKKPVDYEYQRYKFMKTLSNEVEEIVPSEAWKSEDMPDIPRVIKEFKEKGCITLNSGKIQLTEKGKNEIANELVEKYWNGYTESIPKTKVGVLATGDDVQEWSEIFDELSKKYDRKTIALDMEAHAIGCIAEFNKLPYIIAKGVGDYAQSNKSFDNRYIEYSCHTACCFIIEFFNSLKGPEIIN